MRIKDYFSRPIFTHCDVNGIERNVRVKVDYQPPEADVNVGEYAEVTEVTARGVSVLDDMLQDEVEELEEQLLAMAYSTYEAAREDEPDYGRELREEVLRDGREQRRIGA